MLPDFSTVKYLEDIQARKADELGNDFSFSDSVLKILEEREVNGIDDQYNISEIPKGNGKVRVIEAPSDELKIVQQRLLRLLNQAHLPNEVHGFRENSGTIQGLRQMLNSISNKMDDKDAIGSVFQTDLKDFFPSVKADWVEETVYNFLFRTLHRSEKSVQLPKHVISELATLITELSCFNGRLPQGAPTSPILSNIVGASRFDRAIMKNLGTDMQYGRYADDIVVMGVNDIPEKDRGLIISILESSGFKVARSKTEYYEGKQNINIWGLNVLTHKAPDGKYALKFKLPKSKEVEWAKEILEFLNSSYTPKNSQEFFSNTDVQNIIGKLGYAYSITRAGNDIQNLGYYLPRQLAFAWNMFRKEYGSVMTGNMLNSFGRGDSEVKKVENVEKKGLKVFDDKIDKFFDEEMLEEFLFQNIEDLNSEVEKQKNEILEVYNESREKNIDFDVQMQEYFDDSMNHGRRERLIALFIAFARLHINKDVDRGLYSLESRYIISEELFYSFKNEFLEQNFEDISWDVLKLFKDFKVYNLKTKDEAKQEKRKLKYENQDKKETKPYFYPGKLEINN